jgi:hypothetical protein
MALARPSLPDGITSLNACDSPRSGSEGCCARATPTRHFAAFPPENSQEVTTPLPIMAELISVILRLFAARNMRAIISSKYKTVHRRHNYVIKGKYAEINNINSGDARLILINTSI